MNIQRRSGSFPRGSGFQETGDRSNFQGRYIIRHPFSGPARCAAAERYFQETLPRRREQEGDNLASLTGWDRNEIRKRMGVAGEGRPGSGRWWERLWPGEQ